MTEVLFYHLQRRTLEQALPSLLEKCVERGWKTVVQTGSPERRDALDAHLWAYADESFLPHGTGREADAADLPILLTADPAERGAARVRFLVDRAEPPDLADYDRVVFLFDGNDPEALVDARRRWKDVKASGLAATYWAEDETGRWVKKA
ncbi:DNA polymerase III subunit chi [Siculibacillus lacustris]|uniref:DNA polymerase III subunit chi n=1 Tax=Siculibacillus lacustris TaxID=1549641 RepID=A0A4Q9VVE1_9HYPH|nr:DNA polymerase III subunit chi [Siculibacillus lacustris]TBW39767.1 DNA polymerase III subunit chi [Siculibacillus lacustris]